MADKKKKQGIGLPETNGEMKLRGNASNLMRDGAFKSITTKTNKDMNILNFGVETNENSTTFVKVSKMEDEFVYFYKKSDTKGEKGTVKKVAWADRFEDQGEGFTLIGIKLGLEKDDKGKNVTETFTEYDAAEEIYKRLQDNTPVMIIGEIKFSSYKNNKGETKKQKDFNIKQLYLSKELDFNSEDFVEMSDFRQKIIYMGIEKVDDNEDPRYLINAKIVNYNDIQDTEFVVRKRDLANTFRTKLKPYTAIDIWGKIINRVDADEEEQTDVWGEEDPTKTVRKNYIRELEIIGADPGTIDVETYTKEKIDEALRPDEEFGGSTDDNWGSVEDSEGISNTDDLPW